MKSTLFGRRWVIGVVPAVKTDMPRRFPTKGKCANDIGFAMTLFAQWVASLLLIALSLYVGIGQWWAIYRIPKRLNAQGQQRNYSMIPLIGGVIGTGGCLLSPLSSIQQLWWLPLIIDPGCALLFGCMAIFGIIAGAKRLFKTSNSHPDETSDR